MSCDCVVLRLETRIAALFVLLFLKMTNPESVVSFETNNYSSKKKKKKGQNVAVFAIYLLL